MSTSPYKTYKTIVEMFIYVVLVSLSIMCVGRRTGNDETQYDSMLELESSVDVCRYKS